MWGLHRLSPREALDVIRAAIWARRWLVLGLGLAAFGGTIVLNVGAQYTARQVVSFAPLNDSPALSSVAVPAPPSPAAPELTSLAIRNRMVDEQLVPELDTPESLQDDLEVESYAGGSAILLARGVSEQDALIRASGWLTALQQSRRDALAIQFNGVEGALMDQLGAVRDARDGIPAATQRRDLRRQIARLDRAGRVLPEGLSVLEAPAVVRGGGTHNELRALILGLAVGVALALLLELRDGRLRTAAAAKASVGAPVVESLSTNGTRDASPPATVLITPTESVERPHEAALALAQSLAGPEAPTALVVWRDAEAAAALGLERRSEREEGPLLLVREDCQPEQLAARLAALRWDASRLVVLAPSLARDPASLGIAQLADLWLVVVSLGRTRDQEARALAHELGGFGHPPDGVVLAGSEGRAEP